MPSTSSAIDVLQEIKARLSVSQAVATAKIRNESTQVNNAETEARYSIEVRDPEGVHDAIVATLHAAKKFHPDADIAFSQFPDAQNKFLILIKSVPRDAQIKTAADVSPLESAPIAAQINDAVYGIGTDGKEFFVLKNGEKATTAETLAEAFGLFIGLLKQDLFLTTKGAEDFDRLEMDRGFLDGVIPVLLDSPTVSDKAAKALNSFYEMATLKKMPAEGAE